MSEESKPSNVNGDDEEWIVIEDDDLSEEDKSKRKGDDYWKVLIVDDDEEVHNVTRLILRNFSFDNKELSLLNAHSGKEAQEILEAHPEIALVLLDVVMEREDAGLQVAEYIRKELKNQWVRIVLRTGQPGEAPEEDVIRKYDINDYKTKTELTREKLFTTIITSLRSYRDITTIEAQRREIQAVLKAFKRFVPNEFLKLLKKEHITDIQLGDQVEKEMSILFSDIRAFTSLSENMSPQENFNFLNSYLSQMGPLVRKHQGFIDKYIGDSIMAIFDRDADQAVGAAIEMIRLLEDYNDGRQKAGYWPIRIGIGINTGKMMVGTIGEKDRMEGTVISDAVNLAARMETLTKDYGASVLISNHTFLNLKDPSEYKIRFIDQVQVKGKEENVVIYEIYDADPPEVQEKKWETSSLFQEAWLLFQDKSFGQAKNILEECIAINPDDKAAHKYLERCQQELKSA